MSQENTLIQSVWKLKRYGRFLPKVKEDKGKSWKVFESSESTGTLQLMILESGHFLVTRAQELLEGFCLLNAESFLKIQQKSDSLLFHMTLKGESRMIRLQFDGSNMSEAVDACSKAVERLQEYLPGTQPVPAPATHNPQEQNPVQAPQAVGDVTQEALSIKHLSQVLLETSSSPEYFLGERGLSLPLAYRHATLPPGDVEALLRLCLLDSGFPAFVEEVENKLKGLSID